MSLLIGCVATVATKDGGPLVADPNPVVPKIPLAVGFYMSPESRAYNVDVGWSRYGFGQAVETKSIEYFRRAFNDVTMLANAPSPSAAAPNVDLVVVAQEVSGHVVTSGFAKVNMRLSVPYRVLSPTGASLQVYTPESVADVLMGSLSPAENIAKSYEAMEILSRQVVLKFVNELAAPGEADRLQALAGPRAAPPALAARPAYQPQLATRSLSVSFKRGAERPDDIAVIIGNADYGKLGKDIPDVAPAYADAAGAKQYAVDALGVREGNVIFLKDATGAQLTRVFGSKDDHRGQLYDWVKAGKSRVFVYYAGHGAPAVQGGNPYLVPVDADAARIELNGYSLKTLYDNLAKLPAESATVVLEACFSGTSQAGSVIASASPVFARVEAPKAPAKVTVIAAGAADQIASWEQDKSHSLFTKYFLLGESGEADKAPYGDGNGRVTTDELDRYLKDTLTYYARRYYGRDQTAQIVKGGGAP